LTPLVLVALNTGLRRGELLTLQWQGLDPNRGVVTVRASNAKGSQTRHVPLDSEVSNVLRLCHGSAETHIGHVFRGPVANDPHAAALVASEVIHD
jgi:integrase